MNDLPFVKHKKKFQNVLLEITSINRQYNETLYRYKIVNMAFYSYGECRRYDYRNGIYVVKKTSFHILRDTYDIGYNFLIQKHK